MTIKEARSKGITKVRKSKWNNEKDYVDITNQVLGALYSPVQLILDFPSPQIFIILDDTDDDWEEYNGDERTAEGYYWTKES